MDCYHDYRGRLLACALLLAAGALGIGSVNAAVREIYACTYINGADRDDLMEARDFLVKQQKTIGGPEMEAFLWTPYKVPAQFQGDFIWMNQFEDMAAFAAGTDAYNNSDAGRAADARFDKIVSCRSSIADAEILNEPEQPVEFAGPALIASYLCGLKPGQSAASVRDLISHYQQVLASSDVLRNQVSYALTPIVAGPPGADVVFFNVHDNLTTWANRGQAMNSSEAGQMFFRHADAVMDCDAALWWGEPIIPVPE